MNSLTDLGPLTFVAQSKPHRLLVELKGGPTMSLGMCMGGIIKNTFEQIRQTYKFQ